MTGIILAAFLPWVSRVEGANGTWQVDANGNWTGTPANWVAGSIPNGAGDIANLNFANLTAARVITLNAPITLGGLNIGDILGASTYSLVGTSLNTLTFQQTAGNAFVNKYGSATDAIQAPLVINSNLDAYIGAGTLQWGLQSLTATGVTNTNTITKNGAGTLQILGSSTLSNAALAGPIVLNAGTLEANTNDVTTATNVLGSAALDLRGGTLNLRANGAGSNGAVSFTTGVSGTATNNVVVNGATTISVDRSSATPTANSGNRLQLNNLILKAGALTVNRGNSYNLEFLGTTTLNSALATINSTITEGGGVRLTGQVTGPGALNKTGAGIVTLSESTNNFSGGINILAGTVIAADTGVTGTGDVIVNPNTRFNASVPTAFPGTNGSRIIVSSSVNGTTGFGVVGASASFNSPDLSGVKTGPFGGVYGLDLPGTNVGAPYSGAINLATMGNGTNFSLGAMQTSFFGGLLASGTDDIFRIGTNNAAGTALTFTVANQIDDANTATTGPGSVVVGSSIARVTAIANSTGTVIINDDQNYTGNTTVYTGSTLRVENTNFLGSGLGLGNGGEANVFGVLRLGGYLNFTPLQTPTYNLYGGELDVTHDAGGVGDSGAGGDANGGSILQQLAFTNTVNSVSGTIRLRATDIATSDNSAETITNLNLYGATGVALESGSGGVVSKAILTVDNVMRNGQATIGFARTKPSPTAFGVDDQVFLPTAITTPTNGMIAPWMIDTTANYFLTYGPNGIAPAAVDVTATTPALLQGALATQKVDVTAALALTASANVQSLRIGNFAVTNGTGVNTITIGSGSLASEGAGLILGSTAAQTHTVNFAFGTGGNREALIYATTGGQNTNLSGTTAATNLTKFGPGGLVLSPAGTLNGNRGNLGLLTGTISVNQGTLFVTHQYGLGGGSLTNPYAAGNPVQLWGGQFSHNNQNGYIQSDITVKTNSTIAANQTNTILRNVTIDGFPVAVVGAGTNARDTGVLLNLSANLNAFAGNLNLNSAAILNVGVTSYFMGGLAGTGSFEKWGGSTLSFMGNSSGYSGDITVQQGALHVQDARATSTPFGSGAVTVNPGATIRLAARTNVTAGNNLTLNSDRAGLGVLSLMYDGALPSNVTFNATNGLTKGVIAVDVQGFTTPLSFNAPGLDTVFLGSNLGGTYQATSFTPAADNIYRIGGGGSTLNINTGVLTGNRDVQVGTRSNDIQGQSISQANAGGAVSLNQTQSYTGITRLSNSTLQIGQPGAINSSSKIVANGGTLQPLNSRGVLALTQSITINNTIEMIGDLGTASANLADLFLTGQIQLGNNETGANRTFTISTAGRTYMTGAIVNGAGGDLNQFTKAGGSVLDLTRQNGISTYNGFTNINAGAIAVNSDDDISPNSTIVINTNGTLGVWDGSFTTNRDYLTVGNGAFINVGPGLTLTQGTGSKFSGTGGNLVKAGQGTLILQGTNSQQYLQANDGVVEIRSLAAIGDPGKSGVDGLLLGGGTIRFNTGGAITTDRGIRVRNASNGSIDIATGTTLTTTGVLNQETAGTGTIFKTGGGTLIANGANTTRALTVQNGTYQFTSNTPWEAVASGNTSNIAVNGGAIRAVTSGASSIAVGAGAGTSNFNISGGGRLQFAASAAAGIQINQTNFVRQNQGTLVLEAGNAATTIGTAGNGGGRFVPTNINFNGTGIARASVLSSAGVFSPFVVAANLTGVADFVTNDAANGLVVASSYVPNAFGGFTTYSDFTADPSLAASASVSTFGFKTTSDISGGTIRIASLANTTAAGKSEIGGILINGSNTISSNLVFDPAPAGLTQVAPNAGSGEGVVYVAPSQNATLSGRITASRFTKFGTGTLTLSGDSDILGILAVQDGTLKFASTAGLTNQRTALTVSNQGVLDLNGQNVSFESIQGTNPTNNPGGGLITGGANSVLTINGTSTTGIYSGQITGATKVVKSGTGTQVLGGYTNLFPDAGNNTFSGGTEVYQGILQINNPQALGGFGGAAMGSIDLYGGTLNLRSDGGNVNGTIVLGDPSTAGATVNVRGYSTISVDRVAANSGNYFQIGALNMTNNTLALSAGNTYGLRVAGNTNILGTYANFNTATAISPIVLAGPITGSGAINKFGGTAGGMQTLVISGTANSGFTGNINVQAGTLQVTGNSGSATGSNNTLRVFPGANLRIAGNSSLSSTTTLKMASLINSVSLVTLDESFNPGGATGLLSPTSNFKSPYGVGLGLGTPFFNTALDMSTIGDGKAFLSSGVNVEVNYVAATLLPGAADSFVPGQSVYRLMGGNAGNLAFGGSNNVLTGATNFVQISPIQNNFLSVGGNGNSITGFGSSVIFRNANNYGGGTQIARGGSVLIDTSNTTGFALGTGNLEIYGVLQTGTPGGYAGNVSFVNPATGANFGPLTAGQLTLRPGGQIQLNNVAGQATGGEGQWDDQGALNLNGGIFLLNQANASAIQNGSQNYFSYEKIGDLTASKGGVVRTARQATAGNITLEINSIIRGAGTDRGTLLIQPTNAPDTTTSATSRLGVINPANTAITTNQFDRMVVTGGVARAGTTANGAEVVNTGIAPVWMVDVTSNSYMGYNTTNGVWTGGDTGFQTLVSTQAATTNGAATTPGLGQVGYSHVYNITNGAISANPGAGSVIDVTAAQTLGTNLDVYALRTNSNLTPGTGNTITFSGGHAGMGGILFSNTTGTATIAPNAAGRLTLPSTLNFGAGEAIIFVANGGTGTINSQITANNLTKFGAGNLTLNGVNSGLTGSVVVNQGALALNTAISATGTPLAPAVNGRDIHLNGNGAAIQTTLVLDAFVAPTHGLDSVLPSGSRVTGNLGSNVFVHGDSVITNNNQGIMQRINNLVIADLGPRSPIVVSFVQNGVAVAGTTALGANSTVINSAFGASNQTILEGVVSGAGNVGGRLIKTGNGGLIFGNAANTFGLAGQTSIEVWSSTQNTATSLIGTTSLTGTPFGVGDISLLPGTLIRLADVSNIAGQKVVSNSDDGGYSGVSFGYNSNGAPLTQSDILSVLTTSGGVNGKVQLNTTGSALGTIVLDNGVQYGALNLGAMETALGGGGKLWLGSSTSGAINQLYFAPTLGASTDGVYRLGGGGNQGTMQIGAGAFENVLTGATSVQIGALVGGAGSDGYSNQSVVNGNTNITLTNRNNFTLGVMANRGTTLNINNNFALGTGTLTVNHTSNTGVNIGQGVEGAIQTFGGAVSPRNNVDMVADLRWQGNGDLVFRGNVNLAPGGVAGTRVFEIGVGGQGALFGINGIISGIGANLVKSGNQAMVLNGLNTYTGTTTLTATGTLPSTGTTFAGILLGTDVLPNTPGALGNSNTPLLINASDDTQNIVGVGLSGQVTFGRDIIVQIPTDNHNISIFGNSLYTSKVTGGIGIVGGGTNRITQLQSINTGRLELLGPITSSAATVVRVGDNATTVVRAGVVYFGGDANGYSPNTYSGSTLLENARTVIGADSLYTGPADALNIISGPFGSSTLSLGNINGTTPINPSIGSDGANRVIANRLASLGIAGNSGMTFEGRGNLTFINTNNAGTAGAFNLNSDGTLRNRVFTVNTTQGAIQFDANLESSGAQGANLVKTGGGILTITGTNSVLNKLTTDGNYGSSWFIDAGVLRVTADVNLGATTPIVVGTTAHTVAGLPTDVRLRGGVLSTGGTFTTSHQFILTAASGIEVSAGNSLTQPLPLQGAFGLTKTGNGTLVLNSTNANNSLTIGGVPGGGGTVLTQMTSGTPFGSGAITLTNGTLALQGTVGTAPVGVTGVQATNTGYSVTVSNATGIVPGMTVTGTNIPAGAVVTSVSGTTITLSAPTTVLVGASTALTFGLQNQALTAASVTYNAGRIQLTKGTGFTSQLTATTLTRGANGLATLISSDLATDLGVNERFLTGTAQSNANGILALPSIVGRASTGADTNSLNFLRYDNTNGFLLHNASLATDLSLSAATSLGDFNTAQVVAAGTIDVLSLRTSANITPTDGTSLLRLSNGGLIMNGAPVTGVAPVISSNLRFGTLAAPQEALVWVSGGQIGASTISGNFEATDFTKGGAGTLLLSGTANVMAPTTTALRNLTLQEGTLQFAGQSSVPSGGLINLVVNSSANGFDLNGQAITVGGLSGYGRVMNSGAVSTLTVNTGVGQNTTYTGTLDGNVAITKTGNGTLTLNLPRNADGASLANTYSGGTIINAGRVTSANAVAPVGTGTLAVRNTLALGTGPITLRGGILDLAATTGSGYAAGEVTDNIGTTQFGPGSGYNITVDALNSFGQANTTSALATGAAPVAWNLINNVTLNANNLTWTGGQNTNVQINGTLAVNGAGETFLNTLNQGVISGKIDAAGKTLVKTGASNLFLTNGDTGSGANDVGAWRLMAGTTEVRLSNGASNPLGASAPITLNGANLNIRHDGDNTTAMQVLTTFANNNLTIGSTAGIGSGNYIGSGAVVIDARTISGGNNKTIKLGNLAFGGPLGSPFLTLNAANSYTYEFNNLTLVKDANFVPNANTTINGTISGNGTILKQGGNLFINSDNAATFAGGYVNAAGTTFFGTFEGNVLTLSDTPGSIPGLVAASNYGTGNALIQPATAIQFNSTANKVGSGSVDLRSNAMGNYGILRMAANAPLSDFKLLIGNLGGPQNSSYFGLAGGNGFNGGGKNAGSAIIALNTVYTQAINLAKIGDGTAFLGSTTNGVGLNGSYNAATLGVGAGKTYRLGAGGSILYVSSDLANSNVLTNALVCDTNLIVGMPNSGLNADTITAGNGRGTVVLMTNNDYRGTTVVNRASVLEFRGTLATSSFDTWGILTAGGLGGTFMNAGGTAPLAPVTLRNTSEVRFDYSTGLLATNRLEGYGGQGRWDDDTAVVLNNSTIRLLGNRDIEVTETVGDVTVGKFGQLAVQRDLLNRTVNLVVGGGAGADITRQTQTNNGLAISGNTASLQINPVTTGQLGSDERIKLFGGTGATGLTAIGGITNGMVAPWIFNAAEFQFLTYTADNGFVNAGFDGVRSGALGNTAVATERTYVNAAASMVGGGGLALDTYALRMDANIAFANNTTAVATDRIRVGSGGLLGVNNNTALIPGIDVGPVAKELNFAQNTGNFFLGALITQAASGTLPGQSSTTTGQITNATHVIKQGGGNLFVDAAQASFNGNYIVNQGSIFFRSTTVQANLGTNTATTTLAQMNAGTGGLVVINNHGGTLGLRSDVANTVYNLGLVIGEGNPLAILNNDRAAGTANVLSILTGGIRFGGSPGEQGQTLFIQNAANNVSIQVNGPLALSAATMEGAPAYNFIRTDPNLTVNGQVTGGAALIHTGGGTLDLANVLNGINTFTGGIQNVQGTVNVRGTTTGAVSAFPVVNSLINNGGIGSGDVTMYSGTLNLLIDGANNATRGKYWAGNNATGNNLIINGSSTVTANRNTATGGTNKHLAFKDLTIGASTLTTAIGNTFVLEINGATNLTGTPLLNIGGVTLLNGAINDGAGSAPGTIGQALIKGGGESLWLNSATSTFGGLYAGSTSANGLGIVVNGGLLRFGNVNSENGTAMNLNTMLRGSTIRINPNGGIFLTNPANITFGTGQVELLSSGSQMGLFRMSNAAFNQAYIQNALSSNSQGVIALNATIANPLNLALIGNGRSFFGATANSDYTAQTLGVGADNIYRIGGGGARLNFNSTEAGNMGVFVEGVTAGTRLLIGSQAGNGNSGETDTFDLHTYTGGTIISRSSSLLTRTATSGANGPLGNGGAVDIFGQVRLYSGATLRNFAGTANQYTLNLHPGGVLWFDNEGGIQNRYDDATALNLNGGLLFLRAENNAATNTTEVIGAMTFSRGSSIRLDRRINLGTVQLTVADLTRAGVGSTLALSNIARTEATAVTQITFGTSAGVDDAERLMVSAWNTTRPTLSGNTVRNGTPGFANNGILPAYYIDATSNTFLSYNSTTGFQSVLSTATPATNQVAYSNIFAGGVFSANTDVNSVVDITTAAMVLTQDQTVYALRTNQNISSGVGQYNTLTFADGATDADRGGLITTGTPTIFTNLRFGTTGTKEGIIYNTGNTTLSGDLYAGSMTKFGGGALIIAKDQTAAANGTGFAGNWTVNGGALTLNTFGASGDGGTITLNASGTTTGAGTTLNLLAQPGSSLEGQYTMGRIIGVDNAVIVATTAITDVTLGIGDLEVHSTDTTGLSPARLRVNPTNTRGVISAGTLYLTGTGNSILDVAATAVNNQITSGATGAGLIVTGLNGSLDLIKWGNGNLWVSGDNSASFSGNLYIQQGAVGVTNANAFANAGTSITASRYGVLDILTTGFTKAVTYEAGSIERWSVDNARSGTINLGAGSLQVNADQNTTSAVIEINGGAIEAFLRTDDVSSGNNGLVFRTLGAGVSVSLLGNSFVGQNGFTDGPNGTDNGRTQDITTGVGPDTNNNSELVAAARGAILEIKGNISGVGGLTKQSSDTVILSGTNTYSGGTNITNGTLRLGSNTALAQNRALTTSGRGVLDMAGYNASVATLTAAAAASTGVFASSSGFITNSSTGSAPSVLTVGTGSVISTTFGGVIQNNVALTKAGTGVLTLTNANTYIGETRINAGGITLGATGTLNDTPWIGMNTGTNLDVSAKGPSGYTYDGLISGGGTGALIGDNANRATITGNFIVGDAIGEICLVGTMSPGNSSLGTLGTAGDQIGHMNVTGNLTLSGELTGTANTTVDRLLMQLNAPTVNANTLGVFDGTAAWLVANALPYLNGAAGNLSGHDYITVGTTGNASTGTIDLNQYGRVVVTDFGAGNYAGGSVFNLFDWVTALNLNGFTVIPTQTDGSNDGTYDLDLPTLTNGAKWDTSLFASHGVVFIIPEPSRAVLLLVGLLGLFFRRRRIHGL